MGVIPACMSGTKCVEYPQDPEEGIGLAQIGVTGSCELFCRCWELNLCPRQEQSVFLTTKPFFQPHNLYSKSLLESEPKWGWVSGV